MSNKTQMSLSLRMPRSSFKWTFCEKCLQKIRIVKITFYLNRPVYERFQVVQRKIKELKYNFLLFEQPKLCISRRMEKVKV